ncbi:hypothetical protein EV426DRAFT_711785 [Tirmania nivea]|nr:hypothetical protein EV426DRAFT_711785 [Tirmania nivea]
MSILGGMTVSISEAWQYRHRRHGNIGHRRHSSVDLGGMEMATIRGMAMFTSKVWQCQYRRYSNIDFGDIEVSTPEVW